MTGAAEEADLRNAAGRGDLQEVSRLLASGVAANSKDRFGMTALMTAARNGRAACVDLLLPVSDAKAWAGSGWTALMLAAQDGHADCVERLLPVSDAGATNGGGWTALALAAEQGRLRCVELLLAGSDPPVRDEAVAESALIARRRGHDSVDALLEGWVRSRKERGALEKSLPAVRGTPKGGGGRRV